MSEYWLDLAKRVAARAVAAENTGDMELVEHYDDEYMRCLFNYYDDAARSDKTVQEK